MWYYIQNSGQLFRNKEEIGNGYSGYEDGENDPHYENVENVGPIPKGFYNIVFLGDTKDHGPFVLKLTPSRWNKMFGRSGFLIHGDSKEHPGTASHGCIILPRNIRELIKNSDDSSLTVVEDFEDI